MIRFPLDAQEEVTLVLLIVKRRNERFGGLLPAPIPRDSRVIVLQIAA